VITPRSRRCCRRDRTTPINTPHTVPEPDTLVLVGLALAAAIALKKRRK
jgi:hypothetical protein